MGVIKGDARSLDCSSYVFPVRYSNGKDVVRSSHAGGTNDERKGQKFRRVTPQL